MEKKKKKTTYLNVWILRNRTVVCYRVLVINPVEEMDVIREIGRSNKRGFLISDSFEHKPCNQALGQVFHTQLEQNCIFLSWMHVERRVWGLKWAGRLKVVPRWEGWF